MENISVNRYGAVPCENKAQKSTQTDNIQNDTIQTQKEVCSKEAGQAMRGYILAKNKDKSDPVITFKETLKEDGFSDDEIKEIITLGNNNPEIINRMHILFELGNENFKAMKPIVEDDERFSKFMKTTEETNQKIDSIMQEVAPDKTLDKHNKKFLRTYAFNSKYHTPREYIQGFLFFRDLKTKTGEPLLDSSGFLDKIHKNDGYDTKKEKISVLNNNIKELMNLDPASVEASYVEMFLELMQRGAVHKNAIRVLSSANNNQEGLNLQVDWELSKGAKKDIDMLCEVYSNNKNKDHLEQEIKDSYVPVFKTDKEALSSIETGDVYEIEGEENIKIKTNKNEAHPLKISKETYCKLFPPVERFASCQQVFGNCYCIESLMAIYNDENTRSIMLDTISENENGDIIIQFPNKEPLTFKNGRLPDNENEESFSSGALGFRLFEYLYAKTRVEETLRSTEVFLPNDKKEEYKAFLEENGENVFIYNENGETKWTTFDEAQRQNLCSEKGKYAKDYDNYLDFILGTGGYAIDIFNKFDIDASMTSGKGEENKKYIGELLEKMGSLDYFRENIVNLGMENHAYTLTAENVKGKIQYYLFNPHSQGLPLKLEDLKSLLDSIETLTIAKKERRNS